MPREHTADVFVAGAGPVGLFTALCLSERGLRVQIADKYQRAALHSYALALHPRTLRMLDDLGLADRLVAHGQRVEQVVFRRRDSTLAEVDLTAVGGSFPFALVVPQALLESALEERLEANGVQVLWAHPVLTHDAFDDGVSVLLAEMPEDESEAPVPEVSTAQVSASFLVGADGYESLTRRLLGVNLERLGPKISFALLEFDAPLEHPDRIEIVLDEDSSNVLWPLSAERGRWNTQVDQPIEGDLSALRDLVSRRAPWFTSKIGEIHWSDMVTFEPSLAERFGRGRVWLAGDAVHLTSPIGVQNMNVGMREGHDLARRMAAILEERASHDLLRYYNEERRKEWRRLLGLKPPKLLPGAKEWVRADMERVVASLPASGGDLNVLLRQVGLNIPGPHLR